ncbi:MAG: hypothetical protein CL677_08880 [Bdellovibrionaceae bacterium]|nr:hypothetical protein [Pseudobdellovibrionaceae bacterium]|tara:strand:+ start:34182 stop:34922 length:741 start_codon:yes stop_codon:yes gene_type:complete
MFTALSSLLWGPIVFADDQVVEPKFSGDYLKLSGYYNSISLPLDFIDGKKVFRLKTRGSTLVTEDVRLNLKLRVDFNDNQLSKTDARYVDYFRERTPGPASNIINDTSIEGINISPSGDHLKVRYAVNFSFQNSLASAKWVVSNTVQLIYLDSCKGDYINSMASIPADVKLFAPRNSHLYNSSFTKELQEFSCVVALTEHYKITNVETSLVSHDSKGLLFITDLLNKMFKIFFAPKELIYVKVPEL